MSKSKRLNTGLFIDFENIWLTILEKYANRPDFSFLVKAAREYGHLVERKAYADFFKFSNGSIGIELTVNGILQITAPGWANGDGNYKSISDEVMMMDIIRTLPYKGQHRIDTYILATCDGHFIPLVAELKRWDKQVVVLGVPGKTSQPLRQCCDDFASCVPPHFREKPAEPPQEITSKNGKGEGLIDHDLIMSTLTTLEQERPHVSIGLVLHQLRQEAQSRGNTLPPEELQRYCTEKLEDFLQQQGIYERYEFQNGHREKNVGLRRKADSGRIACSNSRA